MYCYVENHVQIYVQPLVLFCVLPETGLLDIFHKEMSGANKILLKILSMFILFFPEGRTLSSDVV